MKNKFIFIGIIIATLCFFSCNNNPSESYYTVTIDFSEYGYAPSTISSSTDQIITTSVSSNSPYLSNFEPVIKSDYKDKVEFYYFYYEENNKRYLFSFNNSIASDITIHAVYRAKSVQNLSVTKENANTIKVEWSAIPGATYKIQSVSSTGTRQNNSITTTEFSQTIADGVTSYNFIVTALSEYEDVDYSKEVCKAIIFGKKQSEWLVLLYMDGDNNLNDPIYFDLNEAESGLSKLTNEDKVTVVALWDGWDFKTGAKDSDPTNSTFDQIPAFYGKINTSSTRLLQLGADSNQLYAENGGWYYKGVQLSLNTQDLTDTVDWIINSEANMSDKSTLESFLSWAKQYYEADKTILQFSNHGGGARSASTGQKYGRRSMCWDETSGGTSFLKTSDVSNALKSAGYGTSNQIDLIMEDVCLGGSLEEAYELKDYAKYYVGSPNNVPGSGFDYISFVSSLTTGATVEEVGCNLVKTYRSNYEWTSEDWSTFIAKNPKYASYDTLYKSICNTELSTLSFIDLSKINSVKNAVNELAQLIYNDTGAENRIMVDINTNTLYFLNTNGKYYDNQGNLPPTNAQLRYVYRRFGIKWWTAYYGDPIYYTGTYGCLKDLGAMCAFMREYYPNWEELNTKANAVTSALSDAIVASWRDGYNTPTYYKIKGETYSDAYGSAADLGAGLTINCSCWVEHQDTDGTTYKYQEFADWYKTDLAFGKDCTNWTSLIENWWGTSN